MLLIREETPQDYSSVNKVIEQAFREVEESNQMEHFLVNRLRHSDAFIPKLSLVAEIKGEIIGHVLLTKIDIESKTDSTPSLVLAPIAILPKFQNQGIGSKLIIEAHKKAIKLEYTSVVLLGHANYYPRFGYKKAIDYGIEFPFAVPYENAMAIELIPNALQKVNGVVKFSKAFTG